MIFDNGAFLYPEGKTHALTMSYDDGQIHDRKLVEIFDKHGIRGTFHLNAGNLDRENFVSANELSSLYKNHEISCHTYSHPSLTKLDVEMIPPEIIKDRLVLEKAAQKPIIGMSYPYGHYDEWAINSLKNLGMRYSRTTVNRGMNALPADFMQWHPTCHHKNDLMVMLDIFLKASIFQQMPLLCVWGHSYEFDRENNWELIEEFCEKASGKPHIWYATMEEIYLYVTAMRGLYFSADMSCVYNPSAISVWFAADGQVKEIPGGQNVTF